jgi:hypothetical protein
MSLLIFLVYAIALVCVPMGRADSDRVFQVFAEPLRQLPEQCAVTRRIHDNGRQARIDLVELATGNRVLMYLHF